MKSILKCRVLRHGQQILPPFELKYYGAGEGAPVLSQGAGTDDRLRKPHAAVRMWFLPTLQWGPSRIARCPDAIDALLEMKTFELRRNSLDRAVERLEQLVREGR